jgi:hypothetical protein
LFTSKPFCFIILTNLSLSSDKVFKEMGPKFQGNRWRPLRVSIDFREELGLLKALGKYGGGVVSPRGEGNRRKFTMHTVRSLGVHLRKVKDKPQGVSKRIGCMRVTGWGVDHRVECDSHHWWFLAAVSWEARLQGVVGVLMGHTSREQRMSTDRRLDHI